MSNDRKEGYSLHIDPERRKRGHSSVEIVPQGYIDIADIHISNILLTPFRQGLQQLFNRDEQSCNGTFYCGLYGDIWVLDSELVVGKTRT